MSGGSFGYLCFKDAVEIQCEVHELERMANTLSEAGAYAAAKETEELIAYIRHAERQIESRRARLEPVWKAAEWWVSCDWSEDQFRAAVNRYNSE